MDLIMSNLIAKMQKAPTRIGKIPNSLGKGTIDFQSRVLPNTLYVGVKSNIIKIGDDTHTISEIAPAILVNSIDDLYDFLLSLDESVISKVIMDNTTDFKIKSLSEFVADVRLAIGKPNLLTSSGGQNNDGQPNSCES